MRGPVHSPAADGGSIGTWASSTPCPAVPVSGLITVLQKGEPGRAGDEPSFYRGGP